MVEEGARRTSSPSLCASPSRQRSAAPGFAEKRFAPGACICLCALSAAPWLLLCLDLTAAAGLSDSVQPRLP